jgi:hypothetical protein
MYEKEIIESLLEIANQNEWQTRHAAENTYCPFCANDDDAWQDQKYGTNILDTPSMVRK